jgi:hypothetical protein
MFEKEAGRTPGSDEVNPLAYGRRTLGTAAALSAVPAVAAAIDQQSARTLHSHAVNMYSAHDVPVDPGLLYLIVYAVAGSLVVLWLTAAVTAWVSRRVASGVGALLVLANGATALAMLFATEYGSVVFPMQWGVLIALPAIAGALAVTLLFRGAKR